MEVTFRLLIAMTSLMLLSLFYCSFDRLRTVSSSSVNNCFNSEINAVEAFDEANLWNFIGSLQRVKLHEVLWDTGATLGVSPNLSDFVSTIKTTTASRTMKGIAKGLVIEGIGEVDHKLQTTTNDYIILRIPTYYVPGANRRIFSPQAYFQTDKGKHASSTQDEKGIQLVTSNGDIINIKYNKRNNLSTLCSIIVGKSTASTKANAMVTKTDAIDLVDERTHKFNTVPEGAVKVAFLSRPCCYQRSENGTKIWCLRSCTATTAGQ
jgi:hypothetical protein